MNLLPLQKLLFTISTMFMTGSLQDGKLKYTPCENYDYFLVSAMIFRGILWYESPKTWQCSHGKNST
jgi:hypothetical protein